MGSSKRNKKSRGKELRTLRILKGLEKDVEKNYNYRISALFFFFYFMLRMVKKRLLKLRQEFAVSISSLIKLFEEQGSRP